MIAKGPVRRWSCRICSAPAPASLYKKYGFDPAASSGTTSTLVNAAWENVNYLLSSAAWASRYSTGDWPVLYTASEEPTARAEKGYWIKTSVFSKNVSPSRVHCLEYELEIEGEMVECLSLLVDEPRIVHPTDYSFCHELARAALLLKVSFMEVPSARRFSATNYPVLRLDAVLRLLNARPSFFENTGSAIIYNSGSSSFPVVIDDVFGSLS